MKIIRLIQPFIVENRFAICLGLLCLIIVDLLQLWIPRIIKRVVDDLTTFQADRMSLLLAAASIIGIAIVIGGFRYGWRLCLIGTSRKVEEKLRNILFDHLQSLSASYFDTVKTGDLMAHATNDVQHVRMAIGMGLVALTDAVVLGSAAVGFMVYIHPQLTVLVLIPMPMIVVGTRFFSRKMHRMYRQVQASFSDLTEQVRERFSAIRIIKAFNRESEEIRDVSAVSRDYVRNNLKLATVTGAFFPMMMVFSNLSLTLVLYLGGRRTIFNEITPGDFVAFLSYLGLLTWPMMAMGWVVNLIQRGKASLERIHSILQIPSGITGGSRIMPAKQVSGRISFENVSFGYGSSPRPVLEDITFEVAPGGVLGIVGHPGSGKTTLLNLIPRVYDAAGGRILIDGVDIRDIRLGDLRATVTCMPQEPFLFAGTIRDNILLGRTDISGQQLETAVKQAALYDTLCSFPNGLDTLVGEKGIVLSGGQRQRVALARAFLRDTPILILDDPISQVDTETGSRIVRNLQTVSRGKTIIVVSHRLSALWFADHIMTLSNGRIIESGTHEQLMASGGYYADTFRLQKIEEADYAD